MTTPCHYEGICRPDCPRRFDDCDGIPELMITCDVCGEELTEDNEAGRLCVKCDKKRFEAEQQIFEEAGLK